MTSFLSGPARAQEPVLNTHCPVMPLEPVYADSQFVLHEGKKVLLCCDKCVTKFQAAPHFFLDQLPQFSNVTAEAEQPAERTDDARDRDPWRLIGKFHVPLIHFPLALLIVAATLELLAGLARREPFGPSTRPIVILGAISSVAAMLSGLVHADHVTLAPSLENTLLWHRILGIASCVLACSACLFGMLGRRREKSRWRRWYRFVFLLAAIAVCLAGHHGGLMVFGLEYW